MKTMEELWRELIAVAPNLREMARADPKTYLMFKSLFMAGASCFVGEVTTTMARGGPRELLDLCVKVRAETMAFVGATLLGVIQKMEKGERGVEVPPDVKL